MPFSCSPWIGTVGGGSWLCSHDHLGGWHSKVKTEKFSPSWGGNSLMANVITKQTQEPVWFPKDSTSMTTAKLAEAWMCVGVRVRAHVCDVTVCWIAARQSHDTPLILIPPLISISTNPHSLGVPLHSVNNISRTRHTLRLVVAHYKSSLTLHLVDFDAVTKQLD